MDTFNLCNGIMTRWNDDSGKWVQASDAFALKAKLAEKDQEVVALRKGLKAVNATANKLEKRLKEKDEAHEEIMREAGDQMGQANLEMGKLKEQRDSWRAKAEEAEKEASQTAANVLQICKERDIARAELAEAKQDLDCGCGIMGCENPRRICTGCEMRELKAANERLREALEDAVKAVGNSRIASFGFFKGYSAQVECERVEKWRQSLAAGGDEEKREQEDCPHCKGKGRVEVEEGRAFLRDEDGLAKCRCCEGGGKVYVDGHMGSVTRKNFEARKAGGGKEKPHANKV